MRHRDVFYESSDGLRLYARDYAGASGPAPVLCLPGLTRNAKDFEVLAARLCPGRRVICPDFRGRGRSQYAADPLTYRADVEMADTLLLLDRLGLERVAIIGTSRGGLVAMLMAAAAPARVAGILFNDIGPRLERAGLLRIRSYLGKSAPLGGWSEAVAALKSTNPGFDSLAESEWNAFARRVFRETDGKPCIDYDPQLGAAFPSTEAIATSDIPEFWPVYEAAAAVPVTVLRGANSDLLSEATVAEMLARHPDAEAVTVAGRGHVPFLDETEAWAAIERFLSRAGHSRTGP